MNKLDQAVKLTEAKDTQGALMALDKAWATFVGGNPDCGL